MSNFAITGHKGLIGTFLKKRLEKEGHKCVLQIDQREGFNVNDLLFKEYEINDKIDIFFHFAAACRINQCIANPLIPHKNNADGILSVLEFCRKHKIPKIVFASTSRVLSPERNPYVASKIYGEEMCKAYCDCYGIDYIIIRPSTVYGELFDETSRLINNWLTAAFKNKDLRFYGKKSKTLDFTYINDFVEGVILTILYPSHKCKWNKEYNISGKNEVKLLDLAKMIIKQVGSKSKIKFLPAEKAQPQQVNIDTSAIESVGYKPKVDIKEGIKRMVKFYRDNPKAWREYIDKGRKYYK